MSKVEELLVSQAALLKHLRGVEEKSDQLSSQMDGLRQQQMMTFLWIMFTLIMIVVLVQRQAK